MTPSLSDTKSSTATGASLAQLYRVGIALAAVTGGIHLWLGVARRSPALFLAGTGFAAGIAVVVTDVRRRTVVLLGVPFTAMQVLLYAVAHLPGVTWVGVIDKIAQVGLVAVLLAITRRE